MEIKEKIMSEVPVDLELVAAKAKVLLEAIAAEQGLSRELGWFFELVTPIIKRSSLGAPMEIFDEDSMPDDFNYEDGGLMNASDKLATAYSDWYFEMFPL
jgi:hypothetical protein